MPKTVSAEITAQAGAVKVDGLAGVGVIATGRPDRRHPDRQAELDERGKAGELVGEVSVRIGDRACDRPDTA